MKKASLFKTGLVLIVAKNIGLQCEIHRFMCSDGEKQYDIPNVGFRRAALIPDSQSALDFLLQDMMTVSLIVVENGRQERELFSGIKLFPRNKWPAGILIAETDPSGCLLRRFFDGVVSRAQPANQITSTWIVNNIWEKGKIDRVVKEGSIDHRVRIDA